MVKRGGLQEMRSRSGGTTVVMDFNKEILDSFYLFNQ